MFILIKNGFVQLIRMGKSIRQMWVKVLETPVGTATGHSVYGPGVIYFVWLYEPAHEIMAHFVLRTLILQSSMRSHPVGLDF